MQNEDYFFSNHHLSILPIHMRIQCKINILYKLYEGLEEKRHLTLSHINDKTDNYH